MKDLSKPDEQLLSSLPNVTDAALKQLSVNALRYLPASQWLHDAVVAEQLKRGGTKNVTPHSVRTFLIECAKNNRTVTYGEIAKQFGVSWPKIRHILPKHLGSICEIENSQNRPLLSALVVDSASKKTGDGFYRMAEKLGRVFVDEEKFLAEEQQRVFNFWAGA